MRGFAKLHHRRITCFCDRSPRQQRNQHHHHHQPEQFQFCNHLTATGLPSGVTAGSPSTGDSASEWQRHFGAYVNRFGNSHTGAATVTVTGTRFAQPQHDDCVDGERVGQRGAQIATYNSLTRLRPA